MGRPKGIAKVPGSGRKKGSVNKRTLLRVDEVLSARGLNPVEEILKLMPDLPPVEQARQWHEILKYVQPIMKAIEVDPKAFQPDPEPSPAEDVSTDTLLALVNPA